MQSWKCSDWSVSWTASFSLGAPGGAVAEEEEEEEEAAVKPSSTFLMLNFFIFLRLRTRRMREQARASYHRSARVRGVGGRGGEVGVCGGRGGGGVASR